MAVRASIVAVFAAVTMGAWPRAAVDLKVGDAAPEFVLPGSDGITYRLSDYRNKRTVVVAWFAKAFTSG